MDIASITATISGLKTIGDIVNSLLDAKTGSAIDTAVRELNSHLISVQREALAANSAQFAMLEEIRNLKKEIADLKDWETDMQRYQLTKLWDTGGVAYAVKKSMCNAEPPHLICTKCYTDRRKSILNPQQNMHRAMLVCPKCNSKIHTDYSSLEIGYAESMG